MKKILAFLGININFGISNIKGLYWFISDYRKFKAQNKSDLGFPITKLFPIIHDKFDSSGILSGHYFHQDLHIAQDIFYKSPIKHVDIGSRTDGFVAHVASFREIEVFDIRPLESTVTNIKFIQSDFTNINPNLENYTDSISCLHAIEHFGLGRYNDTLDKDGHLKGLNAIYKTLKKEGIFYFSTPIGNQRIEFNAHRVFGIKYLLDLFENKYKILSFSYVDDKGDLYKNVELTSTMISQNLNCNYGCGIFILKKI
jgi:hypothetical protein